MLFECVLLAERGVHMCTLGGFERAGERGAGGGGVYSESYTRGARFLTRWGQHAGKRGGGLRERERAEGRR